MEKVENMAPIGIINAKKFMANEDPMMTEIVNGEEQKRKNEKLIQKAADKVWLKVDQVESQAPKINLNAFEQQEQDQDYLDYQAKNQKTLKDVMLETFFDDGFLMNKKK